MRQLSYYKMRQNFITKCVRLFIANATAITKCDDFITKCDSYYKMRRLLQIATVHKLCVWKAVRDFITFFSFIKLWYKNNALFAFIKLSFPKAILSSYI